MRRSRREARYGISALVMLLIGALTSGASAADLEWNNLGVGLLFYDTSTNWDPVNAPDDADNVLFAADEILTVIIGAPSNANNFTVTAGDWTFTGGVGTSLDTEGVVTIDDVSGLTGAAVTLTGPSNWDNVGDAIIGNTGLGELNLGGDADFRALNVIIGESGGSTGIVNVDGVGSLLTADATGAGNGILVGRSGTGTLNVTGGAIARTLDVSGIPDIQLGINTTGEGTLDISGVGSQAITEDLFVGNAGTGHVFISSGGVLNQTINTSPDAYVGYQTTASGDVTVNGDNSAWNMRDLHMGTGGTGTLDVEAGAKVDVSGYMTIGEVAAGDGTVMVTGSGTNDSLLEISGNLLVGEFGTGTLTVEQAGDVTVGGSIYIGDDISNLNNNVLTVTNADSSLAVTGVVFVGNEGTGTLDVTDGAALTAGDLRIGQAASTADGAMTLSGGSTAYVSNSIAVGNDGTGTLLIDTASVMNVDDILWVGFDDGEGTLTVDGVGSELNVNNSNSADVYIGGELGQSGGKGTVNITNGGLLTTQRSVYIGGNATGDGTVNVIGPGSLAQFHDNAPGGAANELTIIGYIGAGKLNITDGGKVLNEQVYIGDGTGSTAADVLVSGVHDGGGLGDTASMWEITGDLRVGNGRKATLIVEDGAQLLSQTGPIVGVNYIGNGSATDGSYVTVTGAGSQWLHEHHLVVAQSGGNSTDQVKLNVLDGGLVEATYISVAAADGSYGVINVDGTDSRLSLVTNAKSSGIGDIRLVPGGSNGTAILNVTGGGLVETETHLEIGRGDASGSASVNVSGVDSRLEVGMDISVSYTGTPGTLSIEDGGAVQNLDEAFIGRGSALGTANVGATAGSDAGHADASWIVGPGGGSPGLYIGGDASGNGLGGSGSAVTGVLNVNPTGTVTVNGAVRVWNRGVVNMNGGTLEFNSVDLTDSSSTIPNNPTFNFNSGTVRFLSAGNLTSAILTPMLGASQTLTTDQHLAVVGAATLGTGLRVNGGTLSLGAISQANMANIDFDAGTINLTASDLVVGATGQFGDVLNIQNDQTVNVTQFATIEAGAEMIVVGGFSSGGLTNHGNAAFIDTTGSGKTVGGAVNNTAGSTMTVIGDVAFTDGLSGAGGIYGPGNVISSLFFDPGDSPAAVTVEGDLTLTNTNTLMIELGGTTAGSQYDQVLVGGDLSLDGILDVALINAHTLAVGQSYTILTADTITGTFDDLVMPTTSGLYLDVTYIDDITDSVVLDVLALLTGDLNGDGFVGQDDLNIVLGAWGTNVTPGDPLAGDPSGDGFVGQDDLNDVLAGWGQGTPPSQIATVPEPGTIALFGALLLVMRQRR